MTRAIVAVLVVLAAAAAVRGQSSIELRSSAKVAAGSQVRLGDLAVLTGPEAEALRGIVLLEKAQPSQKITLQDVRQALSAGASVNWGRLTLRGSICTLTLPNTAPRPVAPAKADPSPVAEAPDSVRRAVSERIARLVQAEAENLRLSYATDDDEILKLSVKGRTLEVKPTAASDKLPLALTLYEGERIVASRTIRVGVLVKRAVVIAAAPKARGETIERADVTIEEQWVGPNLRPASAEAVIGSAAQGRIATGEIIGVADVAPAVIVNKGDQVSVSCVSGSVVVTTKARAMSAGRVGEVIKFQGLEDKRVFQARMSGRGRAVVTAEPQPTPQESLP